MFLYHWESLIVFLVHIFRNSIQKWHHYQCAAYAAIHQRITIMMSTKFPAYSTTNCANEWRSRDLQTSWNVILVICNPVKNCCRDEPAYGSSLYCIGVVSHLQYVTIRKTNNISEDYSDNSHIYSR
jgi:hypothetical protein